MKDEFKVILPVDYWENEFKCDWKNGQCPNCHFLKFLSDYTSEIGPKILDLGSGDGRHLLLMVRLGYKLTGLELTESGIETTRKKLNGYSESTSLVKGDFHNLPFNNIEFDTVVSTQVLHYNNWSGAVQSFAEASRVLKPNGLFFFRARSEKGHWRPTDQQIADQGITRIEKRGRDGFIVMVHDYTIQELSDLADLNRLKIIGAPIDEDIDGKPGQWNVVFRKL